MTGWLRLARAPGACPARERSRAGIRSFSWSLACLLACPLAAEADETLKLRYFGTLGATRGSSDRVQHVRDLSQPDGSSNGSWVGAVDSSLGVQGNYRLSERSEAVAQVVSRYRYDGSFRPEAMWAYLHVTSGDGTDLRLGRLGTDFYMLADSRLVGYSLLAIRPSLDFFGQLPLFHIDGADISRTFPVGGGLLKAKLFAGLTGERVPFGPDNWDMGDSPMLGANLDYQWDNWSFRLGYAQLRLKHDWPLSPQLTATGVPAAITDALSVGHKSARYYSAGLMYEQGPWQAQWMLNHVAQESWGYQNYYSAYVLLGYRLGAFTPYGGASRSYSRSKVLDTSGLAPMQQAVVAGVLGLSHTNQSTWTAGLRWDFRRNLDLKLQWDGIRGRGDSVFLYPAYPKNMAGWNGDSDILSLALDFAF